MPTIRRPVPLLRIYQGAAGSIKTPPRRGCRRERAVETIWDWITVFAFAGLATLLMQRSAEEEPRDQLWQYAPPAVGCALVNYIGNEGYHAPAAILFVGVIVYIFKVLNVPVPFLKR